MTDWPSMAQRMLRRWPHVDWSAWEATGALEQYTADLADLDTGQVDVALDLLAREDRRFPPLAGQVRQKVIELTVDAPSWGEVKAMLTTKAAGALPRQRPECPEGRCDGSSWLVDEDTNEASPCLCRAGRIDEARKRGRPRIVAEFVQELGALEFRDLAGDRTAEAQVREKWEAFVRRRHEAHRTAGLPDAGLPGLRRQSELRRLGHGLPLELVDGRGDEERAA